jgi:hypothetical protein
MNADRRVRLHNITCNSLSVRPRMSWVRCVAKQPVANDLAASMPALRRDSRESGSLASDLHIHVVIRTAGTVCPPIARDIVDVMVNL